MEQWLSLKVSGGLSPRKGPRAPSCLISIPKKVVKQAVRRNRIKRVLREALKEERILERDKTHVFKVLRSPEGVNLQMAKQAVRELLRGVTHG